MVRADCPVPGDPVKEDDIIAQIETDKVTIDVKYTGKQSGVIGKLLVSPSEVVKVGQQVATVELGAAGAAAAAAPAPAAAAPPKPAAEAPKPAAPKVRGAPAPTRVPDHHGARPSRTALLGLCQASSVLDAWPQHPI